MTERGTDGQTDGQTDSLCDSKCRASLRCAANKESRTTHSPYTQASYCHGRRSRIHATLSGFVWNTDTEFIGSASGRIISDIAITTVELGLCAMTLGLLLYCWKGEDKYKRIIHSVCEYCCLVRISSILLHLGYIKFWS